MKTPVQKVTSFSKNIYKYVDQEYGTAIVARHNLVASNYNLPKKMFDISNFEFIHPTIQFLRLSKWLLFALQKHILEYGKFYMVLHFIDLFDLLNCYFTNINIVKICIL